MHETQCGFYSRYFVIPKKDGGLRPILDLRKLNNRPGNWCTTVDLKDAYFHIAILPKHRQFLRFAYEGRVYEYQVPPFGLSLTPCIFTKYLEAALAPTRGQDIRVLDYLDDVLILADSAHQASVHTAGLMAHLQSLGFVINQEKSSLIPGQKVCFLGLDLDSVENRARLSSRRIAAFNRCLSLFQLHHIVHLRQCQQLLGFMASMIPAVPLGLLLMRKFQRWVHAKHTFPFHRKDERVRVTPSCMNVLLPWRDSAHLGKGAPLGQILSWVLVTTDMSRWSWGGICRNAHVNGSWRGEERTWHISILELYGIQVYLTM